ncbi:MAG: class I SAM-dependent methyltransferase [Oligoflexia bacterium]|nr:class I SAM-dependent methyltransferase [Oligoflexia bacterium]
METVKEDVVGKKSLELLEKADNYIRLSTLELSKHLNGKVLELGSGNGNLTQHLAFDFEITALDLQQSYLNDLKNKILNLEKTKGKNAKEFKAIQADLTKTPDATLINQYDSLLSCQVLEHLPDDELVIKNYAPCIRPGGQIVLQLPAHMFAFNNLDKNLGHFRRYSRKSAEALVKSVGLRVKKSYYFNFFGLLGWLWYGSVLKNQILPEKELSIFNILAPITLKLDLLFSRICGLNVIVVAQKPN